MTARIEPLWALANKWVNDNPLGLNESLLAMQAYAPFHHLCAVSLCYAVANRMAEGVPNPVVTLERAQASWIVEQVVDMAGICLNTALEAGAYEPLPANRVFSPQNWIKTKNCLSGIRPAIQQYFTMQPSMPGGRELRQKLKIRVGDGRRPLRGTLDGGLRMAQ